MVRFIGGIYQAYLLSNRVHRFHHGEGKIEAEGGAFGKALVQAAHDFFNLIGEAATAIIEPMKRWWVSVAEYAHGGGAIPARM